MKNLISTAFLLALVIYILISLGYINLTPKGEQAVEEGTRKAGEVVRRGLRKGAEVVSESVKESLKSNSN